jgi:hypothetical protein
MSSRACADIFYGIVFDESSNLPQECDAIFDIEWGGIYLHKCGLVIPSSFLDAISEAKSKSSCYIGKHGYHESPCYYIATVASHIYNDWDAPTQLPQTLNFKNTPIMDAQLLEFCKVMGIPEALVMPKWYLVSSLR